jgi:hypothetical protein
LDGDQTEEFLSKTVSGFVGKWSFPERQESFRRLVAEKPKRWQWETLAKWLNVGHPGSSWRGSWSLDDLCAPMKGTFNAYGLRQALKQSNRWHQEQEQARKRSKPARTVPNTPASPPASIEDLQQIANRFRKRSG